MSTSFTALARVSGVFASLVGLLGAIVLFVLGQPLLSAVFAVFAIAGVGTIAVAPRWGRSRVPPRSRLRRRPPTSR